MDRHASPRHWLTRAVPAVLHWWPELLLCPLTVCRSFARDSQADSCFWTHLWLGFRDCGCIFAKRWLAALSCGGTRVLCLEGYEISLDQRNWALWVWCFALLGPYLRRGRVGYAVSLKPDCTLLSGSRQCQCSCRCCGNGSTARPAQAGACVRLSAPSVATLNACLNAPVCC